MMSVSLNCFIDIKLSHIVVLLLGWEGFKKAFPAEGRPFMYAGASIYGEVLSHKPFLVLSVQC